MSKVLKGEAYRLDGIFDMEGKGIDVDEFMGKVIEFCEEQGITYSGSLHIVDKDTGERF